MMKYVEKENEWYPGNHTFLNNWKCILFILKVLAAIAEKRKWVLEAKTENELVLHIKIKLFSQAFLVVTFWE